MSGTGFKSRTDGGFEFRHAQDDVRHAIRLLLEAIVRGTDAEFCLDDREYDRGRLG